ncbi:nitronate monooxygenase [Vallitalea pronyensis]|uniref:Probable nitronate monooxygenase n=1 Tax=Vallitalea pronyensis TaxID=1348613 RepID=A0A8J8SHN4_9FIRM|nr:nitronate monooxygenase family protein [Vallitalea pronyensis]QUI23578.1 nitronate monooxygenase [Vallitalea pronyensis]
MNIPRLKIGDLDIKVPIIQGGMGIGVSKSRLASAVANEGGVGVISGVQIGYMEPDFSTNTLEANMRALSKEIRKAREKSPKGILGVNLMVAMRNYKAFVKTAIKEKIDIIISGAGLPLELPKLVKNSKTKIVPIVSSKKAARIILKQWEKVNRLPDAIIVEGAKAGGHLGFKAKELMGNTYQDLQDIVKEVIETVAPYEEKYHKVIPVIAAGGILEGVDIGKMLDIGAGGVQMGSRFVATNECDANDAFKKAYIEATKDDICLLNSPVGLPGRAIHTPFIDKTNLGRIPAKKCTNCLIHCNPANTPYCISDALIHSVNGEDGLVFSGERAGEIKEIVTVKKLFDELIKDLKSYIL